MVLTVVLLLASVPVTNAESPSETQDRLLPEFVLVQEPEPVETPLPAFQHPTPYDRLVCSYDWPCVAAQAVMFCESSGNPDAFDGYNSGLMQVAGKYHSRRLLPGESLFDPEANVRVAHEIWLEQGWGPWPYCGRRWR